MRFLEKADDAYIKAFQFRVLGDFPTYATEDVTRFLQKQILYYNTKLWGTKEYRIRNWEIVSSEGKEIVVRKELKFKNIKLGHTLVTMGDECVEYWKILVDNNKFKVGDIVC